MTDTHAHVVVVGAAAAGTATALNLRRAGHAGPITLVGDEPVLAYDRPPLSKGVLLGTQAIGEIGLATAEQLAENGITVLLGARATGLDPVGHRVLLDGGEELAYDTVVIATGASPRRLPALDGLDNVHAIRTDRDATRLAGALRPGRRLGVVGGGLIGLEVAASARKRGLEVTVVEPAELPLAERLTVPVSSWLMDLHRGHGVDLRLGRTVADTVTAGSSVAALALSDGAEIPVDEVLVAVGATPNTGWLESSGLELGNGVRCDEHQRAAEDVYVVGDVAEGYHPVYGRHLRMETRTNATEGPFHLARTLTGGAAPYAPVPFFWTDQYDAKVQAFGIARPGDEIEFVDGGSPEDERWIAVCRREGRLVAFVGRGAGKPLLTWRRALQNEFEMDLNKEVAVTP
ncbi:FAD-dependent oxidoreductase [Nocardioides sp. YIM 152588]|uniref:NAD(P)/FAD-dependent oxidoreductase n=1 Tax=Nocardioides sp. YIM 152588 TaxID=3158259 RepID=UPI0032E3D883